MLRKTGEDLEANPLHFLPNAERPISNRNCDQQASFQYEATAFGGYRDALARNVRFLSSRQTEVERSKSHSEWQEGTMLEFSRDAIHNLWNRKNAKVILALFLLGGLAGAVNWLTDQAVHLLKAWYTAHAENHSGTPILQFFVWVGFCVGFVVLAVLVTAVVSPSASGSGIPEMKVSHYCSISRASKPPGCGTIQFTQH